MPNNMRGQASAIYLLVVNMMGLALGPLILAMLTDYVFTGESYGVEGIRYSLLSLTVVAHLVSTLLLWEMYGLLPGQHGPAAGSHGLGGGRYTFLTSLPMVRPWTTTENTTTA